MDIEETQGHKVNYPMIGDPELKIAKLYDMLPADAGETSEGRTPANNATVRTVFVVGPDKKIKLQLHLPHDHGAEILRRGPSLRSHRFQRARNSSAANLRHKVVQTGFTHRVIIGKYAPATEPDVIINA